jgi:hypothetical protein
MFPRTRRAASSDTIATLANAERHIVQSVARLTRMVEQLAVSVEQMADEQGIQMTRTAQLQTELDAAKKAWEQMRLKG